MRVLWILGALVVGTWALAQSACADVPTIPVTRTWGDLSATTPIVLDQLPPTSLAGANDKPPFQFWIGVDRDHLGEHGAVLFYCLTKGHPTFPPNDPKRLGPFTIRVKGPVLERIKDLQQAIALMQLSSVAYTLYTQVVPVDGAGTYTVELRYSKSGEEEFGPGVSASKDGPRTVARVVLKVAADKSTAFWSAWGHSAKEDDRRSHGGVFDSGEGFSQMIVSNPFHGVALPKPPPQGVPLRELPAPTTPLPSLLPEKADPALVLQLVGNTLVVTLPHSIDPDRPDDHFLTRWWINGKPWQPDLSDQALERMILEDKSGLRQAGSGPKSVHFQLDFQPQMLGVKKGDVIGVQLLFCPEGWTFTLLPSLEAAVALSMQEAPADPLQSFAVASNRVEFTYSGDPAAPER